jgi:hypothetical protein
MAAEKVFKTQFKINAVWQGGPAVAAAQRSLGGVARAAQQVNTHMRGMTASVFKGMAAYGVASKAIDLFTEGLRKSVEAASDVQKAHDELGTALSRNAHRYKNVMGKSVAETTRIINESKEALIAASEEMEKTGHDAETLQKGFAKLAATGALDPKQILEQRQAFSDVLSYINGANASAEDSQRLGELWADSILRGNIALAKQMDLTDGEINLLRNVNAMVKKGTITGEEGIKRRQDLILKFAKKFDGETKRVFETPTGKIAQMWTQVSNIFENLGKPFIDRAGEMAESFKKIAVEMQPISEKLADIVDVKLKGVSDWLEKNGDQIPERLDHMITFLERLWGVLDKIRIVLQTIEDFEFGGVKWLYEHLWKEGAGVPAKLPQLPGAPSGVVNPALQGGKAGQRAAEAQAKAEERAKATKYMPYQRELEKGKPPPHKYMPYLRDLQSASAQTAAAQTVAATAAAATQQISDASSTAVQQASNPAHVKRVLAEAENRSIPAPIRNRNPGAMYGGEAAKRFGSIGTQSLLGGKHQIAQFPTAVHGAAANYWNLANKGYVGLTVRDAMVRWSGGYRDVPGPAGKYDPNMVITRAMVNDPKFAVPFLRAIASAEAPGGENVLTAEQWKTAHDWFLAGGPPKAGGGPKTGGGAGAPPKETIRKAEAVHDSAIKMLKDPSKRDPFGIQFGAWNQPKPAPPPKPLDFSGVPKGSSLKDVIKDMSLKQRMSGATGGQNIAMNAPITVNGVAPGREALMAKKTALALRDPTAQLLAGIKQAQRESNRTGYV